MRAPFRSLRRAALAAAVILAHDALPARAATLTIINLDGAGEGFNDPTAVAPVGGNPGTTLGDQRLNVFNQAAAIWGGLLTSPVTILIEARFDPQFCTPTSAVLGSAGPNSVFEDFPGAEVPGTWYVVALASKLAGSDLDPGGNDIGITFNSDVDNSTCLGTRDWYYGYDGNEGTDVELLPVVLHEMAHGLGFLTLVDGASGEEFFGDPDIYERFMLDISTGKHWDEMTDAERQASAVNNGSLVWDGPAVTFRAPLFLAPRPQLVVNAPGAIAGTMPMGRASFGAGLSSPGLTADVVLANDGSGTTSDACSALINGAAVAGKIALVDRSSACSDLTKAGNVQAAGAAGILYADNVVSSTPPTLGGTNPSLTLTAGTVRQSDGTTLKNELGNGLNVTLTVDETKLSGADNANHVLLYAPNSLAGGSSLSHFDVQGFPNLIMEPALTPSVHDDVDLTRELFEDIGWLPDVTAVAPIGDVALRAGPNPFTRSTTIRFTLERGGAVEVSVHDVSGRRVRRLAGGWMAAGVHALPWDGSDDAGRRADSGVYFYRVAGEGIAMARSVILLE